MQPQNIQVVGAELAIQWDDTTESFIGLEKLRRACPCAACGGEPDVLGNVVRPEVTYLLASFQVRKLELVGGYALQVRWQDGHDTGLYTYPYLKRLGG